MILSKLSSGRVQAGIGILLFVFLVIFFTVSRTTGEFPSSTQKTGSLATRLTKSDITRKDSDNDGLTNWEENLYRTNPQNSDSDGDGASDEEEIAKGKNPLATNDIPIGDTPPKTDDPKSAREQFAKNLDTQYLRFSALAEGNLSVSILKDFFGDERIQALQDEKQDAALQLILQALLAPAYEKLPKFNPASVPDELVIIFESEEQNDIRQYFNQIATIYEKKLSPLRGEEDQIINNANEGDKNALKKLSHVRLALEDAQKDFIKIPVPRALLTLHKRELWLTQNAIAQLKLLAAANIDDPVYLILLLDFRSGLRNSFLRFHTEEIPTQLSARGITFTSRDKARLLYSTQ